MRVGINSQLLSLSDTYRATGLSNYIQQLISGLSAVDHDNQYTIFMGPNGRGSEVKKILGLASNFQIRTSRLPTHYPAVRFFWEQTATARLVQHVDVFHSPVNVVPLVAHVPHVVTIHDLAFMIYKDRHLPIKRRYLSLMTKLSVRRSRCVIADSENTRKDIIRLLGVTPEKVVTIPLGVDPSFQWRGGTTEGSQAIEAFRTRMGLPQRYFLYLGTLEPRKNIPHLLHGYAAFRQESIAKYGHEATPKLVLAGPKGWMCEPIFELVKTLGLQEDVLMPGFVAREDLIWWYNAALGFVYLSAYEGFGLPPLQAMACGVPVIVNNSSSLPEVVGDTGILVSADDVQAVSAALWSVAGSDELREDMRIRGLAQAARFSWQRTAESTLRVYEQAAKKKATSSEPLTGFAGLSMPTQR